ncbi:MAG TPA: LemA family protein, partial [Candidatus Acetothermia bacterium]|nr:LemA family protein [Candidatus Acetothermia bacterium]
MTIVYVVIALAAFALIWAIGIYNGLIRARQHVKESWSAIDTELKRRYDLIPNLVETVKGYATHEADTLEAVVQARNTAVASKGSPDQQAQDENVLVGALRQLFAVVEAYP